MLKISVLDSSSQRRLVIEGKLVGPWSNELGCSRREESYVRRVERYMRSPRGAIGGDARHISRERLICTPCG